MHIQSFTKNPDAMHRMRIGLRAITRCTRLSRMKISVYHTSAQNIRCIASLGNSKLDVRDMLRSKSCSLAPGSFAESAFAASCILAKMLSVDIVMEDIVLRDLGGSLSLINWRRNLHNLFFARNYKYLTEEVSERKKGNVGNVSGCHWFASSECRSVSRVASLSMTCSL